MVEIDNSWDALLRPWRSTAWFTLDPRPAFVPTEEFRLENAWFLAEVSRAVYRDDGRPAIWARAGLREVAFFDRDGTQCAVLRPVSDAEAWSIVAFRGTSEVRDWLTNLHAFQTGSVLAGHVHRGFRSAWRDVRDDVAQALEPFDDPVVTTGHSLGGALATLCAAARPCVAAYTFGAPRVGDREFATGFAERSLWRVVHGADIVPSVPPSLPGADFAHVGTLYRIGDDRSADTDDDAAPDRTDRQRSAFDPRRWLQPAPFLADHAPVNYVAQLERLLDADDSPASR